MEFAINNQVSIQSDSDINVELLREIMDTELFLIGGGDIIVNAG